MRRPTIRLRREASDRTLVGFLPCRRGRLSVTLSGLAKPLRIIFSLCFTFSDRRALIVQLNLQGLPERGGGNGRPRPPKRRTVDLRPGDYVLC
jgi:hypothetical protein